MIFKTVQLANLKPGENFRRIRSGNPSAMAYTKLFYNRANKVLGYKASYTCGRADDIGYSIELKPTSPVIREDDYLIYRPFEEFSES